jgi:hypothetical protein
VPHHLISGIGELVAGVGAVLEEEGSSYVGVDDIADVPKACAGTGGRRFDGYVQLPATFTVEGGTAVERMHHFFADGVLARFPAVAAALPVLSPGAMITFVMGVLPPEVSTTDDVAARAALVRVLGHGARADGPPGLRISVLDTGTPAREIALTALGRSGPGRPEPTTGPTGRSYADWRTELLGMMAAQS